MAKKDGLRNFFCANTKIFHQNSKANAPVLDSTNKGIIDVSRGLDGTTTFGTSMLSFGSTADGSYIVDMSIPVGSGSSVGKTIYCDPTIIKNNIIYIGHALGQSLAKPPPAFLLPGLPGAPIMPGLP